jgi:hypothetical protein
LINFSCRATFFIFAAITTATSLYAQLGGFGGPSVLGRTQQAGRRGGQAVRLRGFASLNGIYDSGLTSITRDGVLAARAASGTELFWGAYGGKNNRRSSYGLDYLGDFRYYNKVSGFNGVSQFLTFTYSNQPYRRVAFDLSAVGGTTNRAFGVGAGGAGLGAAVNSATSFVSTNTSFFDVRTNIIAANGGVTLIYSPRLSSSFSGGGYSVRRKNRLPGIDGVIGRADLVYRLGRRQSIGADLQYYKFDYTNAFGDVNVLDGGLLYSHQFGRSTELGMRLGAMRIESFGTRSVTLEPEIAQLLGVAQTSEIFYKRSYLPSGGINLTRHYRRGSYSALYQTGPSPGNGIVLVARQHQYAANASYSPKRRLSISASGGYVDLDSASALQGRFNQYTFGGGLNYKMNRQLEFMARVDRRVAATEAIRGLSINGTRFSAGIIFSPDELPVQLW